MIVQYRKKTGDPDDYFTALNIPRDLNYASPGGSVSGMRIPYDNYNYLHWAHDTFDVGHFFGGTSRPWVKDIWRSGLATTPWSKGVRDGFDELMATEARAPDGSELLPWLDSMTLQAYYENVLGMPPEVTTYYDPIMASIIGLGCDAISAYWGQYFRLPGFEPHVREEDRRLESFPGGNAGIARHFVKKLIPDAIDGSDFEGVLFGNVDFSQLDKPDNPVRMRLNSTAVRVEHSGVDRVAVTYTNQGRVYRVQGRTVVMGSGGWVNRNVIRDLPASHRTAYESFAHSPVLVANVALTNWRFLERLGVAAAIWSGGFGFTCNIRRPMIVGTRVQPLHPDQPIVLTFYAPVFKPGLPLKEQGIAARAEVLGTPFAGYEQQIRQQMVEMFSDSGFDPVNDIAGIILNRWGHAYCNPGPGFMYGVAGAAAPPDVIREPFGRIAIGHSELRGHQYWSGAAGEGRRAVEALIDQYF
jgi:spermidine dehydrogenase